MELTISGGTPEQQELCRNFVDYTVEKLCGKRLKNVLILNLDLTSNLHRQSGTLGNCMYADDPDNPREFDIEIDSTMKMRWLLITLAHELVHVKQYAKRELRQLARFPGYSYQGKRYKVDFEVGSFDSCYTPWEVEARGMEEVLFIEWAQVNQITDDWVYSDIFAQ